MNILITVMLLWSFYNVSDLIIIEDASNKISFIKLRKCKLDPSSIEKVVMVIGAGSSIRPAKYSVYSGVYCEEFHVILTYGCHGWPNEVSQNNRMV